MGGILGPFLDQNTRSAPWSPSVSIPFYYGHGNIDTVTAKSACVERRGQPVGQTSLAPLWRTENPLPRFNVQSASVSVTQKASKGRGWGKNGICWVKRLIRDKRTKKFLTEKGSWTTD